MAVLRRLISQQIDDLRLVPLPSSQISPHLPGMSKQAADIEGMGTANSR